MRTAWRLEPVRNGEPIPLPAALFAPPSAWPGRQRDLHQCTLFEGNFLTRRPTSPTSANATPRPTAAPVLKQTTLSETLMRAVDE